MKLSAAFLALAAAQDDGSDRWSFYDYDINAGGKVKIYYLSIYNNMAQFSLSSQI